MGDTRSLTKIGEVFAAVVFTAVAPYKSAYAQTRIVRNFGVGSFPGRPGFGRFDGRFGRFDGRFGRNFGTNIVVVPSVGPAAPYYDGVPAPDYGVPPMAYYGRSPCYDTRGGTILHRQVETPNGLVSQPVFV